MLPKANRANTKEIDAIFKGGKFLNSPNLTFKYLLSSAKADLKTNKISFIAPKSVAKLAVKRNALRRKGYRILKKLIDQFPFGIVGAFIFRKFQDDSSILENEIENILSKIN